MRKNQANKLAELIVLNMKSVFSVVGLILLVVFAQTNSLLAVAMTLLVIILIAITVHDYLKKSGANFNAIFEKQQQKKKIEQYQEKCYQEWLPVLHASGKAFYEQKINATFIDNNLLDRKQAALLVNLGGADISDIDQRKFLSCVQNNAPGLVKDLEIKDTGNADNTVFVYFYRKDATQEVRRWKQN